MGQKKKNIRFIRFFVVWILIIFFPLFSYSFVFDPWQLFHKPWFRNILFIENSRFQDAGIINNYDFDSVILGTSIAQNFSINEASQLFSSSFVNLSLEAGLFSERSIILNRILQKKSIHNVILSLDFLPETAVGEFKEDPAPDQYDFLYNRNKLDDFRLYMDWGLFGCWNFENKCTAELPGNRVERLNELYIWQSNSDKEHTRGVEGWCRSRDKAFTKGWLNEIISVADNIIIGWFPRREVLDKQLEKNLTGTFEAYIVPYIKKYPDVKFNLFFPPYSRLRFALLQQGYRSVFDLYCQYIEYVVSEMDEFDNVHVFGFETEDFLDDLDHYSDVMHYDPGINSRILHWMARGDHELTTKNIHVYIEEIGILADRYDLLSVAVQFRQCMEQ